jgi:hypothetical protein
MLAAVFLTTCQTVFSEILCPHAFPARQTHGTGTVRMCLPLPIRSTIAQRSSQRCKLSSVSSASSRRRRPQPGRMARIARLRSPVRVCPSGTCQSAASPAVSQLPKRDPSLRTPLTRWIPAANSGLKSPESAATGLMLGRYSGLPCQVCRNFVYADVKVQIRRCHRMTQLLLKCMRKLIGLADVLVFSFEGWVPPS